MKQLIKSGLEPIADFLLRMPGFHEQIPVLARGKRAFGTIRAGPARPRTPNAARQRQKRQHSSVQAKGKISRFAHSLRIKAL
jgi:hypothetical protein